MMRIRISLTCWLISAIFNLLVSCDVSDSSGKEGWEALPQILSQIIPPTFPIQDFNIIDYGAVGDGKTDCTDAFRTAILECHASGGGHVIVPEGIYLTGAIHLKSNVNMHVTKNATILFSRNPQKYLPVVYTRFEGVECINYSPLVYAYEEENIAITGSGALDGQAGTDAWWPWKGNSNDGCNPESSKNVLIKNSFFDTGDDCIAIKSDRHADGRRMKVASENIVIQGCTMKDGHGGVVIGSEMSGNCHNIYLSNVTSRKSKYAISMVGYERSPVTNFNLDNCGFDGVQEGNMLRYYKSLNMKSVYINGQLQK